MVFAVLLEARGRVVEGDEEKRGLKERGR